MSDSPIYLRPLVDADITENYLGWFRDPVVTRFLDARNISREDALRHLHQGTDTNSWHLYAICLREDDCHIGNLKIGPINWRHATSDLVTVIGDRSAWGKGYARAAIAAGIRIAFEHFGIRKLSASIDSLNTASIGAYSAAGFAVEARLPNQFMAMVGGRPALSDKVYVGCFNPTYSPVAGAS